MPWLHDPNKKPEPQAKPTTDPTEPFHVDITDEEYMQLPWTVQWADNKWHCLELNISHSLDEMFTLLCRNKLRMHLSKAVDGIAPPLPAGYVWDKNGRPKRDPGPARLATTKQFGRRKDGQR